MKQKKRKIRVVPIVLLAAVIVVFALAAPPAAEFMRTESRDGEDVTVTIEQGSSLSEIADVLKENNVIKYKNVFIARVKADKKASALNYGTFLMNTGMSITDVIDTMEHNKFVKATVTLTVPEGFSAEQIARRAADLGLCGEDAFLKALDDEYEYDFLKEIPDKDGIKYKLQGFLFPKTYEFYTDATAHEIIDTMLSQFETEMKSVKKKSDISLYDAITMASLIEREAKLDEERPMIAGVMYNRIKDGMRLQIDATVAYVVSDGRYDVNRVTHKDLKVDSPYNTYKVNTLPAGPIANPGLSSIQAAYNPDKHDYYYYHTDTKKNDGSHIFTKTYDEHLSTMN